MEVAFFTDSYPPFQDGVSAVTGGLARSLARGGHTVRVFAPNPGPGATETVDKGVHRFLDAVESAVPHSDPAAVIGGQGPEEGRVRERLAKDPLLASHVRYVGPVAETEKAALLSPSDVFVLPSTSDTSSVAVLEAMACGAPAIAPDSGGESEIVQDGVTGWKVPVTVPGALAEALGQVLDAPGVRRLVGTQAVEFVRRAASLDSMARRFISLHQLAEERRHRGDRSIPA